MIASWPTRAVAGGRRLLEMIRRNPPIWATTLVVGALHLTVAERYDIFRNELYFIVCGRHPDFGYVDQPPLAAWVRNG